MAHPEILLLTRVIDEKNFRILKDNGIDLPHFTTAEGQAVFKFLQQRFHNRASWGTVPSMDVVQHVVRTFEPVWTQDPIEALVEEVVEEKVRGELLALSEEISDLVDRRQSDEAVQRIVSKASSLDKSRVKSRDIDFAQSIQVIRDRYQLAGDGEGLLGIPTPWEPLTEETMGLQAGHLILYYGRPGAMKTWMAIETAAHAYLHGNARVLFYTREMTEEEIAFRLAASIAKCDYGAFRKGRLQESVEIQTFEILDGLLSDEEILAEVGGHRKSIKITTAADMKTGHTVEGIQRKVEEHNSDIIIADGIYRMGDLRTGTHSMDWKNIAHISQDLKELAKRLQVPIVGVTQANKGGKDLAYADALLQECDLALRLILNKKNHELTFIAPKLREADLRAFVINAYPAHNFEVKEELDSETAQQLKDADDRQDINDADGGSGRSSSLSRGSTGRRLPKKVFRQ